VAEVADLAVVDEVGERPEGLVDVGAGVRAVDLVEVDPVGVQASQGLLDSADDAASRGASQAGVVAHRKADLGRQDDLVPLASRQRLADDLLRFARGVDVCGVDEVDSGVDCGGMMRIDSL
jgi:hypothetical protein